jgi:hypothetical protein
MMSSRYLLLACLAFWSSVALADEPEDASSRIEGDDAVGMPPIDGGPMGR